MYAIITINNVPRYKVKNPTQHFVAVALPQFLIDHIDVKFMDNDIKNVSYSLNDSVIFEEVDEEKFNACELEDLSGQVTTSDLIHLCKLTFEPTPPMVEITNGDYINDAFKRSLIKALVKLRSLESSMGQDEYVDLSITLAKKTIDVLMVDFFSCKERYAIIGLGCGASFYLSYKEVNDAVKEQSLSDFYKDIICKAASSIYFKNCTAVSGTIGLYQDTPTV